MAEDKDPTIWLELRGAGLVPVAVAAALLVIGYALAVSLLEIPLNQAGQFGDAFGALTSLFNALAFSGLVATVILQSRELRATRRELTKQAEAQRESALAARAQLEHDALIEQRRIL